MNVPLRSATKPFVTFRSPLAVFAAPLLFASFGALACSGEGNDDAKPGGGLSANGTAGAGGSGHLSVGGRSGTGGSAGADSGGSAGSAPIVEPDDCDCLPVDPTSAEGPGYLLMGEPKDTCAGDELPLYRQANPTKCAPPICFSTHVSYYESSCVNNEPVRGEYTSGVDDYDTCRPLALAARGSALFENALVYWSCNPGDKAPAFDEQYCVRQIVPPTSPVCPANTVCVPRAQGRVCVPGVGAPPAGWVKGDYARASRCIGTSDDLTSPMNVKVFAEAGCQGTSTTAAAETCVTFAGGEPRSYIIQAPAAEKSPAAADVLEDVADLHCRL